MYVPNRQVPGCVLAAFYKHHRKEILEAQDGVGERHRNPHPCSYLHGSVQLPLEAHLPRSLKWYLVCILTEGLVVLFLGPARMSAGILTGRTPAISAFLHRVGSHEHFYPGNWAWEG